VNLLANAIKYTEEGSVCLSISTGQQLHPQSKSSSSPSLLYRQFKIEKPFSKHILSKTNKADNVATKSQEHIIFDISDSGIGIPPEQIEKLFKPHSQVISREGIIIIF
jgi:signal transduction histidine kinase